MTAAVVLLFPLAAGATVVTAFVTLVQAAQGQGWGVHPDQTGGGTDAFVQGPATPPAGIGSLQMTVASTSDRALVFFVPKPATGSTPPGNVGPFNPTLWSNLSGSFSTFTKNTTSPGSSIPVLKIVGYQVFNDANPLLSTGFTTLNFEGSNQGTVAANQWQPWTLGPTSTVWQSNTSDSFCQQASPCTLAQFAAQYADGAWGQIQVGLGGGLPAGSSGYVDNVRVSDGTQTIVADFEVVAPATTTTTTTTTTSPTSTPTTSAPVATAGSTAPVATTASELPKTGAHSNDTLAVGLAGITFGTALAVVARRRRTIR